MRLTTVVLLALLLVGGIHWYLWRRLVRDTTDPGHPRRAGTCLMVLLAVLVPATAIGTRALPFGARAWLAWPGYVWLALMFYLLILVGLSEVPRLALRRWATRPVALRASGQTAGSAEPARPRRASRWPGGARGARVALETDAPGAARPSDGGRRHGEPDPGALAADPGRRLLLARSLALGAAAVAVGTTGTGFAVAAGPPRLRRLRVVLAKLPRRLDGTRIALVSDIHLGPMSGRTHTERIVNLINGLDADLVTIVGDLADGTVAELGSAAEPLARLRSRYGGFFVTGNHEYYSGYLPWVDEVRSLGLRVLRNERVSLGGLDLAGVNDVTGGSFDDPPDYARALRDRDPALPVVLLAHQPVQVHEAARHRVDLQLSGHTHGGQLYPFHYLVRLQQPVVQGYARFGDTQLFVTRGAGSWGPPVRVGAPPDVTLVELRAP